MLHKLNKTKLNYKKQKKAKKQHNQFLISLHQKINLHQ